MGRTEVTVDKVGGGSVAKRISKKTIVVATALAVCLCSVLNGTVAYLGDMTETIATTFSAGFLKIDLTNPSSDFSGLSTGSTQVAMASTVKVEKYSDACWLFVQCNKTAWNDHLSFSPASGWTSLGDDYPDVYYRKYSRKTSNQSASVLLNNRIDVSGGLTEQEVEDIKANTKLELKAYAIGQTGLSTAAEAWQALQQGADAIQDYYPKS